MWCYLQTNQLSLMRAAQQHKRQKVSKSSYFKVELLRHQSVMVLLRRLLYSHSHVKKLERINTLEESF